MFAIVSFVLLVLTRPIAQKHLMKDMEKTNIDGLIGVTGLVTETIDNTKAEGVVVLDGKEWTARSVSGEIIEKDSKVKVDSISGVKLMVTKSE